MSEPTRADPATAEALTPPFLLRGVARAIDLGVQLLLMEAAFRCSALLPDDRLLTISEDALFWVDLGVGLAAFITYSTLSEWLGAATFGKFCTGLRVTRADQPRGALSVRAALIRNAAFLLDGLFFGLVAYSAIARSERGQRVGDDWAGTVVVWRGDGPERSGALGWLVGAAAAFVLVVASYLLAS